MSPKTAEWFCSNLVHFCITLHRNCLYLFVKNKTNEKRSGKNPRLLPYKPLAHEKKTLQATRFKVSHWKVSFVTLCSDVSVVLLQLQSDLDQEYQDKFRRLPVEIQEFVQDSSKAKLSEDCLYGKLPASSTTERLNHKTSQSEDEMEEGSTERVYDTAL